jgi:hypothetical protein
MAALLILHPVSDEAPLRIRGSMHVLPEGLSRDATAEGPRYGVHLGATTSDRKPPSLLKVLPHPEAFDLCVKTQETPGKLTVPGPFVRLRESPAIDC